MSESMYSRKQSQFVIIRLRKNAKETLENESKRDIKYITFEKFPEVKIFGIKGGDCLGFINFLQCVIERIVPETEKG